MSEDVTTEDAYPARTGRRSRTNGAVGAGSPDRDRIIAAALDFIDARASPD